MKMPLPLPPSRWPAVLAAAGLAAALACGPLRAADTPEPAPAAAPPAADPLGAARAHVAAQRWAQARAELQRLQATGDADWQNLMGYVSRKQAPPDLVAAQRHYDEALRLNPSHRGALEYAGELALMKDDPATAQRHLATLERVCGRCGEQADLASAITAYRAKAAAR